MGRRCRNQYRNCQNDAVSNVGQAPHQRLCAECLGRRREKQRKTAMQPTCSCGNKMGIGRTECRGCEDRRDARISEFVSQAKAFSEYSRTGVIPTYVTKGFQDG